MLTLLFIFYRIQKELLEFYNIRVNVTCHFILFKKIKIRKKSYPSSTYWLSYIFFLYSHKICTTFHMLAVALLEKIERWDKCGRIRQIFFYKSSLF